MASASDIEFDALTVTGLTIDAGNGVLVDNADGTWSYTPAADDDADVSFTYTITDGVDSIAGTATLDICLLYTSPSPRDRQKSRMPSSA